MFFSRYDLDSNMLLDQREAKVANDDVGNSHVTKKDEKAESRPGKDLGATTISVTTFSVTTLSETINKMRHSA